MPSVTHAALAARSMKYANDSRLPRRMTAPSHGQATGVGRASERSKFLYFLFFSIAVILGRGSTYQDVSLKEREEPYQTMLRGEKRSFNLFIIIRKTEKWREKKEKGREGKKETGRKGKRKTEMCYSGFDPFRVPLAL